MAFRTKLAIIVLATIVSKNVCESELLKSFSSNNRDDILRGSDEAKDSIERDVIEDDTELEEYSTTEAATTDAPDLIEKDGVETTIVDVETTTEVVDNNVVGTTLSVDIYNTSNIVKAETTTPPPPTTRAMESMEAASPSIAGLDEEPEGSQRSPKLTETSRSEPYPDRPFFEPSPPPEAVSPQETLKSWLEEPWLRTPTGIVVPLRPSALARAKAVWDELIDHGLNLTDITLIGFDANGVNWRSHHKFQRSRSKNRNMTVSEALSKLVIKYQSVHSDALDATVLGLMDASKAVPYDSALFLLTDREPGDLHVIPDALNRLVSKRQRVYVIWTNSATPPMDIDYALDGLRNVTLNTEGEMLTYTLQGMEPGSNYMSTELQQGVVRQARLNSIAETEKFETLLVRKGTGAISLGIPVEYGVTALKIHIDGAVEHAVLYPPNEAPQVDLYNKSSVQAFSPASRTEELSPRDVYLVFPGADPLGDSLKVIPMKPKDSSSAMAGMWHLSVRCDTCEYQLSVSARAQLRFHATAAPSDMLKIRVMGPVASVRESLLVDEYGEELAKLPFSYQPITGDGQDVVSDSPMAELEELVAMPVVKAEMVYAKILGRDLRGEPFVRMSGPLNQPEVRTGRSASLDSLNDLERAEDANSRAYMRLQINDSNVLPYNRAVSQVVNQQGTILTAVQIGLSTRLYGTPGDSLQLHFEVTNYRDQSVRFTFEARGELMFLRGISPTSQTVLSGQTVNVIVYVGITNTAQPGARDLITFTASGIDQVSISSYVYVVNTVDSNDVWAPELRHNFQGMCIGRMGDDCAQNTWSVTIIARDASAGLLRLTSTPIGLIYDSNFVAGTREEIRATYRATCCAPRLSVTAVDANGNVNSYVIDISGYLNGASIAAITLGVFLFIAIIALVIFLVYWCVRRRKESRELPYTTSTRNIS